jgi:hypothetical protein
MLKKLNYLILNSLFLSPALTDNLINNNTDYQAVKYATESQLQKDYSGNIGTGIKHKTVSSTGGAVEFSPSGATFYVFFSQTLGNSIFYDARLYGKNNYRAQNPIFPAVPVSNENIPFGYGAALKLGYDFRPNQLIDIIPYLRFNAYNNLSVVYQDNNGNSINSETYAILPGVKIAYKVTPQFNPYVEMYGGWQQTNLSGNFAQSTTPGSANAVLTQYTLTYEIGFSSKLTQNLALIPYIQYNTTQNNPDDTAAAPYAKNGFNMSSLDFVIN